MTYQDIIKQTEDFTDEQKQQLGYYFLLSSLNEDKRNNLMQLFNFNLDSFENKLEKTKNKRKLKYSGAEDFGMINMNNLRNDIYSYL